MPKKKHTTVDTTFRQCANRKSRTHPDVQCTCPAVQGDFCARHVKNPVRFKKIGVISESNENLIQTYQIDAVKKLQRWWRVVAGLHSFFTQGPAYSNPSLAENDTELFTFEPCEMIPKLYRWSYADKHNHIWMFDIRSLYMTRLEQSDGQLINPYTREPLTTRFEQSFHSRCQWLRDRKYCLTHVSNETLTPEQIWHHTILDMILKYDMLGYHICVSWIEELHLFQLQAMYIELWELWFYKLSLEPTIKEYVVPGWQTAEHLLFKFSPTHIQTYIHMHTSKKWWQQTLIELLERLVSSAHTHEHKILGALYGMTAFAVVSPRVRAHYPWIVGE